MPLNLRQIEVFRAVMLTGSISGAAELLFVSQPAVSRLLAHTEQTAGFTLFDRIKGRLYATPEARQLFTEVENAYLGVQRVNSLARDLAENRKGTLRVIAHTTVGGAFVPQAIGAFHRAFPDVRLSFDCGRLWVLKERMLNQQADLAVTLFPMEHPNLEATFLRDVSLVCVLPRRHPLAAHARVAVEDLRHHPVISYEEGTPFGLLMARLFASCGLPSDQSVEAGTPREACALVEAGLGAAIADEFSAREYERGELVVRSIAGTTSQLQATVVYKRYQPLSRIARAFIDVLQRLVAPDTDGHRRSL